MPKLSDTMTSGKLVSWKKKLNDVISVGDVIADVETDKAVMELESFEGGVLSKLFVSEGETIAVGGKICSLDNEVISGENPKSSNFTVKEEFLNLNEFNYKAKSLKNKTSPYLKFLTFQKSKEVFKSARMPNQGTKTKLRVACEDVTKNKGADSKVFFSDLDSFVAKKLTSSKQNVPHFYIEMSVDVSKALLLKKELAAYKVTVNDFVLKATALALKECPEVNSSWVDESGFLMHKNVNVGFAVDTKKGIAIPVVPNCDSKSMLEVSSKTKELIKESREGSVLNNAKCTFTVTNLGMYGVKNFFGIINSPNSGILSVGTICKSLRFSKELMNLSLEGIEVTQALSLSFSGDHRVLNGVKASIFLDKIKSYLENPISLIV